MKYRLLGMLVTLASYNSNYAVDWQTSPFPNVDFQHRSMGERRRRKEQPHSRRWEGDTGLRTLALQTGNWQSQNMKSLSKLEDPLAQLFSTFSTS